MTTEPSRRPESRTSGWRSSTGGEGLRFFCDAGLGGLARWLRAAGFEAFWKDGLDDSALLKAARECSAIILTTDGGLMERRLLRDGLIPSLLLSPTVKIPEQLGTVFRHFKLVPGQPRCMACGGELEIVDKHAHRDRIPPRTFLWLDEFFQCRSCNKLFWHGTHWGKIQRILQQAASPP